MKKLFGLVFCLTLALLLSGTAMANSAVGAQKIAGIGSAHAADISVPSLSKSRDNLLEDLTRTGPKLAAPGWCWSKPPCGECCDCDCDGLICPCDTGGGDGGGGGGG